jgi:ergothioneine biosynthesis protein EgtB
MSIKLRFGIGMIDRLFNARQRTEQICEPLLTEDYVIQSMADVSPPKWHLAHTTWFFETFLLLPYLKGYREFHPKFQLLFNSYYHGVGEQFPRNSRGLLSRPSVQLIYDYRLRVDQALMSLIENIPETIKEEIEKRIELGIQHEQQHQELLLMDIKYNFYHDPCFPSYHTQTTSHLPNNQKQANYSANLIEMEGGMFEIGHQGNGFCFDIELPKHQVLLKPYAIANRLVTNGEYYEFILSGGYQNPQYWLADGWEYLQTNKWQSPLYWKQIGSEWYVYTLSGLKLINFNEPVVHVSYYEADAFAKWRDKRLPTELEWENFVIQSKITCFSGNFYERLHLHPLTATHDHQPQQFFGDVWEWTATPFGPYPGFKPLKGVLGEYNGKFMNNQQVLRGGCCITPNSHIRASYRNFFQSEKRWQFSGIRLASDIRKTQYV